MKRLEYAIVHKLYNGGEGRVLVRRAIRSPEQGEHYNFIMTIPKNMDNSSCDQLIILLNGEIAKEETNNFSKETI